MRNSTTGLMALRIVLKTAGISQADLARELGCSKQWVFDVLHGRVTPSPSFVRDVPIVLAGRLNEDAIELRAIFFGDVQPDTPTQSVMSRRVAMA